MLLHKKDYLVFFYKPACWNVLASNQRGKTVLPTASAASEWTSRRPWGRRCRWGTMARRCLRTRSRGRMGSRPAPPRKRRKGRAGKANIKNIDTVTLWISQRAGFQPQHSVFLVAKHNLFVEALTNSPKTHRQLASITNEWDSCHRTADKVLTTLDCSW